MPLRRSCTDQLFLQLWPCVGTELLYSPTWYPLWWTRHICQMPGRGRYSKLWLTGLSLWEAEAPAWGKNIKQNKNQKLNAWTYYFPGELKNPDSLWVGGGGVSVLLILITPYINSKWNFWIFLGQLRKD